MSTSIVPNSLPGNNDIQYKYAFDKSGGSMEIDVTPQSGEDETDKFHWSDLDPAAVSVYLNNYGSTTYTISIGLKPTSNGISQCAPNGACALESYLGFVLAPNLAYAEHIADLVRTAIVLSQKSSNGAGGAILLETVGSGLGDGTSTVDIENISPKSIYLTASTENCSNLEITQCGAQLSNVRVAPKSTVHFWIDREDDAQPWSYTVSCLVNGSQSGDCATGGGGGPKS